MKNGRILEVGIALSVVILTVTIFHSTVQGQKIERFAADTGIISLGPEQLMRIIVNAGDGDDTIAVRFRQIYYLPVTEPTGITRLTTASQSFSAPITLVPGEAASLELAAGTYGRGIVLSSSQKALVTIHVVNKYTNQVDSILIALLVP